MQFRFDQTPTSHYNKYSWDWEADDAWYSFTECLEQVVIVIIQKLLKFVK